MEAIQFFSEPTHRPIASGSSRSSLLCTTSLGGHSMGLWSAFSTVKARNLERYAGSFRILLRLMDITCQSINQTLKCMYNNRRSYTQTDQRTRIRRQSSQLVPAEVQDLKSWHLCQLTEKSVISRGKSSPMGLATSGNSVKAFERRVR